MEKLPYLKDFVQTNIPMIVTIAKRVGQYPETDYNTKQETGRMQTLYNFTLPDGTTVRHYAKEREEETLRNFAAGEDVQVVRQESDKNGKRITFLVWTPTEGAEARLAANPPRQSNTQQTATQREMKGQKEEQEEKSIAISLQGFMQAYVSGTSHVDKHNTEGTLVSEALAFAVKARAACLRKAKELHLGIAPLETPSQEEIDSLPF